MYKLKSKPVKITKRDARKMFEAREFGTMLIRCFKGREAVAFVRFDYLLGTYCLTFGSVKEGERCIFSDLVLRENHLHLEPSEVFDKLVELGVERFQVMGVVHFSEYKLI
jgi:hypothetical protein